MQVETELRGMFSYSLIPIIILLILLIIVIILFKLKRKNTNSFQVKYINKEDKYMIKQRYLAKIVLLLNKLNSNKITSRHAYQELSSLFRNFIYEVTGIKVQYYTLKEIEYTDIPNLKELIREYYQPEFSYSDKGNIEEAIIKTKEVIEKWN